MRIWAFPSFYAFDYPGFKWRGIFAHRQYKGLIENGAELTVIQPIPWYPPFPISQFHPEWKYYNQMKYPYHRVYDGIQVYHPRVANMKPSRFFKKPYPDRYADAIIDFFRHKKITLTSKNDIFYSQWLPDAGLVQLAAHKLAIKSAVLSIGDDVVVYPKGGKEQFEFFKKTWVEADMRFTCADYLGKETNQMINRILPYDVVRWGVDYAFFKPVSADEKEAYKKEYNIPSGKIILLTIGSAIKRKGWLDLFDALKELKKQRSDFLLLGVHASPTELNLTDEANKRGLSEHFLNLGEILPQALNKIYNVADVFCLPSHWEGLANVVIEAMSSGLPVITTNVCGHPEIIIDNKNGIMIPPKRPDLLYKQLNTLISDEGQRQYLGANARYFIVNEWGNFIDNAAKLYERLSTV